MVLVAGVDSSTQSCKVVIRDAETGALVRHGRAAHPDGTEVHPREWWHALSAAIDGAGGLDDVAAVAVGGQQHGMVCLDDDGRVVRPALLWNDTRSARAAADLVAELGGRGPRPDGVSHPYRRFGAAKTSIRMRVDRGRRAWAEAVGLVPVASFTVSKLRWLAEHEPEHAARTTAVCLPHDWLTWQLAGAPGLDALVTDRGDASGTGYWSASTGSYRRDLLELAFGRDALLPRVLAPNEPAGQTAAGQTAAGRTAARRPDAGRTAARRPDEPAGQTAAGRTAAGRAAAGGTGVAAGVLLGPGTGDNAAAALGLGAGPGVVVVSIGTSGVVSAVAEFPAADPSGTVAGFADATGRYLPLVATLNAARVLDAVAAMLRVEHHELSRLALTAEPGAGGLVLVPYLEGERTPDRPDATGAVHGLRLATATPAHLARAAVEGLLCGLADGLDALVANGARPERVLLVGGGAASEAVRRIAPAVLGVPVDVPQPSEYVADGAARQAAWVHAGSADPPPWQHSKATRYEATPTPQVRARYREVQHLVAERPQLSSNQAKVELRRTEAMDHSAGSA